MEFETCTIPGSKDYVLEFIEGFCDRTDPTETTAQKILDKLKYFEQLNRGQLMRAQHIKQLIGELYEVRVLIRRNQFRFLGYIEGETFYMVHAIKKKTQTTPAKAIALAQQRIKILQHEN